jgi:hypothetical protein
MSMSGLADTHAQVSVATGNEKRCEALEAEPASHAIMLDDHQQTVQTPAPKGER